MVLLILNIIMKHIPLFIVLNDFPNWCLFKVFLDETNATNKVQKIIDYSNDTFGTEWIHESKYVWRSFDGQHLWIEPVIMNNKILDRIYVVLCDEYQRTLVGVYTSREQALNKIETWLIHENYEYVYTPDESWDYNDHTIRIWEAHISDWPTLTKKA